MLCQHPADCDGISENPDRDNARDTGRPGHTVYKNSKPVHETGSVIDITECPYHGLPVLRCNDARQVVSRFKHEEVSLGRRHLLCCLNGAVDHVRESDGFKVPEFW